MNWRSLFGALYAQDVIRINPNFTLTLGFRGEFSTGWNEAHGRAANYTFTNGVISNQPRIASGAFTENNAKFLPQPRIGFAWSLYPGKTVVRAGFGMYNELQDAFGYRMDQNAPFNPTYSIAAQTVAKLPIDPNAPVPAKALLVPGGVQPNLNMPTLISYTLRVEQELTPNTTLTLGYVGSHGYHEIVGVDANTPVPTICPASPCPSYLSRKAFPSGLAGTPVPAGSYYIPAGAPKANPTIANTWTWFSVRRPVTTTRCKSISTIASATAFRSAVFTPGRRRSMMGTRSTAPLRAMRRGWSPIPTTSKPTGDQPPTTSGKSV